VTSKLYRIGSCSALALVIAGVSAPAFAAGTTAGTSIVNTATVDYQVGGVSQPQQSASDTFVVDRRISLTLAEDGNSTTVVVPGQPNAVTSFLLTNTSNAVLDFALTAAQTVGGTAAHGGTDSFNLSTMTIYRDVDNSGTFNAGDTVVTYIDELAADATVRLFVVGNVPAGLSTGAIANVRLTATGREGGGAGSQGAALTQSATQTNSVMDTVFGDSAGVADGNRDAAHSDDDDFTVSTATLTVTKTSTVVSDPVNGTTAPRLIPGAVVQYCIAVQNAAGGAAASSVLISDVLPANLTFSTGSIRLDGTLTGSTCNADGTAGGTFSGGTVSGTLSTIAPGSGLTLVFRATVN
jgi:uncharacterized repeat protein (TIGR01451 family)